MIVSTMLANPSKMRKKKEGIFLMKKQTKSIVSVLLILTMVFTFFSSIGTAKATPGYYNVTFSTNGVNGVSNMPSSGEVASGAIYTIPKTPVPTRSGYTFAGYYDQSSPTCVYQPGNRLTNSIQRSYVLIPKWTQNVPAKYSVSYVKNDTVSKSCSNWPANTSVNFGTSYKIPTPTKERYICLGFEDEKKVFYKAGSSVTITKNLKLTPVWRDSNYATNSDEPNLVADYTWNFYNTTTYNKDLVVGSASTIKVGGWAIHDRAISGYGYYILNSNGARVGATGAISAYNRSDLGNMCKGLISIGKLNTSTGCLTNTGYSGKVSISGLGAGTYTACIYGKTNDGKEFTVLKVKFTINPKPTVSVTSVNVSGGGETRKITVYPQGKTWNVSNNSASNWITAKKENNTLVLTIKENASTVKRSGTVAITIGDKNKDQVVTIYSITVSQAPKYSVSVNKSKIDVPVNGNITNVTVAATGDEWFVTSIPFWITLTKSGSTLRITTSPNTERKPRIAKLTIKCGMASTTITVSQNSCENQFITDHTEYVSKDDISIAPYNSDVEKSKSITKEQKMVSFRERSPEYNTEGLSESKYIANIRSRAVWLLEGGSLLSLVIPDGVKMFDHYLNGDGSKKVYNATSFVTNPKGPGIEIYNTETNKLMRLMEQYLTIPGQTMSIAHGDAGENIIVFDGGSFLGMITGTGTGNEALTVGGGRYGITASCSFNGTEYSMELNFFILDYYDFYYEYNDGQRKQKMVNIYNDELAFLEAFDRSHPFETCGIFHTLIKWTKGDSADITRYFPYGLAKTSSGRCGPVFFPENWAHISQ